MSEKNTRTLNLTQNQQKLEDWINDSEESGRLLNALGIISDEELAAGIHKEENFRVRVEMDPAYADQKAAELEKTGEVSIDG